MTLEISNKIEELRSKYEIPFLEAIAYKGNECMFKKTFGEIKRRVKVEAITSLLGETELTMEEIAEATGFADRYSMGKFFKKNAGATPGAYRKGVKK